MIDRRHVLLLGAAALAGLNPRAAQATSMSRVTAYAFTFKGLDGDEILLSSYAGHPVLVVNTASLCGYTRNMPACRRFGRATVTAVFLSWVFLPTISAVRSLAARATSTALHRASITSRSR